MRALSLFVLFVSMGAVYCGSADAETPKPVATTQPQLATQPTAPAPTAPVPASDSMGPKFTTAGGLKVSGYIYASLANQAKFDSATINDSGTAYSGSLTLNMDSTLGIGVETHQLPLDGWGWAAGLSYDFKRDITSGTLTYNGSSLALTTEPSLAVLTLYGNAVYRWHMFYLPFGLNISAPNISGDNTMSVSGGAGGQVGAGWFLKDNFALELLSRATALTIKTSDAPSVNSNAGYMGTLQFSAKYDFN